MGSIPPRSWKRSASAFAATVVAGGDEDAPRGSRPHAGNCRPGAEPAWATEIAAVRGEVDELRNRLETLAADVRELKSALGVLIACACPPSDPGTSSPLSLPSDPGAGIRDRRSAGRAGWFRW